MPRRREAVAPAVESDVIWNRLSKIDRAIANIKAASMEAVQVVDTLNFNDPSEGMVCIDWPTKRYCWYHDDEWICVPPNPTHAIKVYGDKKATKTGDGAFRFSVERDLDNMILFDAGAFLGTVASGSTVVQISNRTRSLDMLTAPLTIPGGDYDSYPGLPSINTGGSLLNPNNRVVMGDRIWIDVDTAGAGGMGLGVYLTFTPFRDPEADNPT